MANVYTGAMGMISYQLKLDTVGNNIANSKTEGFKRDDATFEVFREGLRKRVTSNENATIGNYLDEVHVDNINTDFTQGRVIMTDRPLDLSIQDTVVDGRSSYSFFEVEYEGQKLLTRNGNLQIDSNGNLALANGAFILNTDGERINLGKNSNVSISSDGEIKDATTGRLLDKIQVRTVREENTGYLAKTEANMFKVMSVNDIRDNFGELSTVINNFNSDRSYPRILKNVAVLEQALNTGTIDIFEQTSTGKVSQSRLETSNVDITKEMPDLIEAQRGIQANSKSLSVFDQINEIDANKVGATV